ncbi:LytR/AlgR family response regulator transcription factor [Chitinophagaceae bacterium LWZ2-11]
MINCLIIDDEQYAIDMIADYVQRLPGFNLVASTTKPLEGLNIVSAGQIDLIFLDIQMPQISGLEFIRSIQGKCKIILTTAYSEFALEGFELDVVDYLLKPIAFPRFLKATQKAVALLSPQSINTISEDFIWVKTETKGVLVKIKLADIDYIEGMRNYVAIHYAGIKKPVLLNMKDFEERLPKKDFMRVHKSYIVALNKINSIEGNVIYLESGKTQIIIGDTYRAAFHEAIKGQIMNRG